MQERLSKLTHTVREHNWLCAILLLQLLINAPRLGSLSLWLDEAFSALMARRSISDIHRQMFYDAGPPLYYDLLHFWRTLFGESEIALRGLSLLFSLITTVILYRLASRFWNRQTAILTCLFWTVAPLSVYYAQEARNYTMLASLTTSYAYLILNAIETNQRKWIWYTLPLLVLMVYTHNMAWFVALPGTLLSVIFLKNWENKIHSVVVLGMTVVFYSPWIPVLLEQMRISEMTIGWIRQIWTPAVILQSFYSFLPGGDTPAYVQLPRLPELYFWFWLTLWLIPFYFLLYGLFRNRDRRMLLLISLWVFSLLGPYLYSLISKPVYLAARTDFCIYPLFCLTLAYAILLIGQKITTYFYASLFLIPSIFVVCTYYFTPIPMSEKDTVLYLEKQGKPGDSIITTGLTRPVLEYYLAPQGFHFISYPNVMQKHLAHFNPQWLSKHVHVSDEMNLLKEMVDRLPLTQNLWITGSIGSIGSGANFVMPDLRLLLQNDSIRISQNIRTPRMGLRKLNEPTFIQRLTRVREVDHAE